MSASRRLRPVLVLSLLVAPILLAGCTERVDAAKQELEQVKVGFEAAKQELGEAREQVDETRRELAEAKDRFDRVRSLSATRSERVDLELVPVVRGGLVIFEPNATRSNGVPVPAANLTSAPRILVVLVDAPHEGVPGDVANATFACDPLDCSVRIASGAALFAWEDSAEAFAWQVLADGTLRAYRDGAWADVPATEFGFRMGDALVGATTSVGDATA